jgi:hypothetical protein
MIGRLIDQSRREAHLDPQHQIERHVTQVEHIAKLPFAEISKFGAMTHKAEQALN